MALASSINGLTGTQAEVDSNNNLKVNLPTSISQSGFAAIAGRIDDGTVVAGGRTNRVYVTEGNSMKVAVGTLLWDDTFNATIQNTSKYKVGFTTQAVTASGGYFQINSGSSAAANGNSGIQTFRVFPLFAKSELRCNTSAMITVAPQTNCTTEFGLFNYAFGGVAPTDGVFFRWNSAAELRGVISYAGTETTTSPITSPSINVNHDFVIVVQTNTVTFWIDDILVGKIVLATDAPGLGQPMSAGTAPWGARQYIGVSTPTLASVLKISDVFITYLGPDLNRPWPHVKAGFGHMGSQTQNGTAPGSTSNLTNNQTFTAAALTNTTALITGLGGVGAILPTLAVTTDGIFCSFQNPAGSTSITARTLVITGVSVGCAVQTVLTGGPCVLAVELAFGHTAVSLATTETASFATNTTKAPRRIALGITSCIAAAAAGVQMNPIALTFQSPIIVSPGEFVAIVIRNTGVVTSAGALTMSAFFDAHWE